MNLESQIREFITQNLLFSEEAIDYGDDDSFLEKGLIDSIGVMELVTYVGETFRVAVDPLEVTPENFDSVRRLAAYIRRKTGEPRVTHA